MLRKPTKAKHSDVRQQLTAHEGADEALRLAEARYRILFEQSPNGIVLIDVETRKTIEANAAACAQLGYTREEFAALEVSDYEARETPAATLAHVQKVVAEGSDDFETLHRTKNGEIRNVRVWARTVSLGRRKAFYCIFQDITDRRRAEQELRESEKKLRSAQVTSGLGSYVTDFASGRWESSDILDQILGIDDRYDRSVEGWLALVHPAWRATMSEYLANGVLGRRARFDKEYQIVRANDGMERWVHGMGDLDFDDRGQPIRMSGTIQDITERKAADESRQLQSAALDAAANAIVITDRSGAIQWVNRAFTALTGYSAAEVAGKNPRLLKSGNHEQPFYQMLWNTVLSGRTWRGETTNRRKDGSLYTEYQTITPVVSASGAITHFVALKEDITERLRLQAQLVQSQKMESIGRLAGGVAHDFNNLLTVILSWTEMALGELPADHALRSTLEEVYKAGEGAASLTRQLLAFSRQNLVAPVLFDVNELIVELDKMLRRLIGEDITFVMDLGPELGTVNMDRGQLEQVLLNLAVNARDAMPQGGKLTIQTAYAVLDERYCLEHPEVAAGEYVMIAVSDSGVGMSDETRAHVFEPFFTTKELGKGTGLGLATCHAIVTHTGGHIVVHSRQGLGTTVRTYLPRKRAPATAPPRDTTAAPKRGSESVLLVEDDDAVRRATVRMLELHGYRVVSVSSAEEALRLIADAKEAEPLDLLLTDVVLAEGMSGGELADRARAVRPKLKVLFASGYTPDITILHGLREREVALLHKPFTADSLARKVREVLDAPGRSRAS